MFAPATSPPAAASLLTDVGGDPGQAALVRALFSTALPGEIDGIAPADARRITAFVQEAIQCRRPGVPNIRMETLEGTPGVRRMALAIVNDDMPFLVDSVSAAIVAHGLPIERLLHPIVATVRDGDGRLLSLRPAGVETPTETDSLRESLIYMEIERAGAKARAALLDTLGAILADVRAAVGDWPAMLDRLRQASAALARETPPAPAEAVEETRAFLDWLAADHFTLLGVEELAIAGDRLRVDPTASLGLLRTRDLPLWPAVPAGDRDQELLIVTKASAVSTVHRRVPFDGIELRRFDANGRVIGARRFVGLFTSQALRQSSRAVPLLRRKVAQVIAAVGFAPNSHAGKALVHVLETFPRDELFQIDAARLSEIALGLLSLLDRPRAKLFTRADPFGRFLSVLTYLPRDTYRSSLRERVADMLASALGAKLARYEVEVREEGLARVHYLFEMTAGAPRAVDEAALDSQLLALVRGWDEALATELVHLAGATRGARLALTHGRAFSASYRAQFTPEEAAADIMRLTALASPAERDVLLYRHAQDGPARLRLKIYRLGQIIPLSEAVPVLEHFGFCVVEEFAFDLDQGRLGWIHDLVLEANDGQGLELVALRERLEPALRAVLVGAQENDPFNTLVMVAGLDAEAAGWLRAYFRYMRQIGVTYGIATVVGALRRSPLITADLVALFRTRFDPRHDAHINEAAAGPIRARIEAALATVTAIDDDRILRLYGALIEATLRTNAFVPGRPEALAFKFQSDRVPNLPPPVPYREIFVYSPRIEGIHLRGGPIARGGLRWSDRRDDFRTEILGLVKAQMVKNAVIVPTGAKGGFYPKQLPPPANREAWLAEGMEAYRIFIRALLSLTDNLVEGRVVGPEGTVAHDAADPYLVVAADKGTASFSDVANAIALERGFWLGDAFASGGGHGYDHKKMGITARGAWISVQRHFRELGIDVQTDPVRVIGVGDMSGDVFGNGMLLSRSIKLVAAFDHRHIFLDPEPNPAASFAERERLFALPRSSWADYDVALISAGGGVFPRDQKSIPLSPEIRALLDVKAEVMTPSELIAAILKSPAELCWFGGIGTYVKAAGESHADVGDRANDAHRVNAEDMRVRVIGEGANLGVTQAGRIAFARRGGRINTDFIDNSAGVDCSDNEVNIKIALASAMAAGRLTFEERNALLEAMTEDVAALVLRDNVMQTQALSVAERDAATALSPFQRLMQLLEADGRLDRAIEGLPNDEQIAQRAQMGQGLERPELAVLLAYAKMAVYDAVVKNSLPGDMLFRADLMAAFPPILGERFAEDIEEHRLRREIIATKLANQLVNRGGIPLAFELAEEAGTGLAHVATAFVAARELFDLRPLWRAIDQAEVEPHVRIALHTHAIGGLRLQMADLLRNSQADAMPSTLVATLAPGVGRLTGALDALLHPEPRAQVERYRRALLDVGAPAAIVDPLVRLRALDGAIGIAHLAQQLGADERRVAEAYSRIGERLGLDWAAGIAAQLTATEPWERLLLAGLAQDFAQIRLDLIRRLVSSGGDPLDRVSEWLSSTRAPIERLRETVARARGGTATAAMLAHVAHLARALASPRA